MGQSDQINFEGNRHCVFFLFKLKNGGKADHQSGGQAKGGV